MDHGGVSQGKCATQRPFHKQQYASFRDGWKIVDWNV